MHLPDAPLRLTQLAKTGGCGAKLSPGRLRDVLSGLPRIEDPRVVVGTQHPDDAAVLRLPGGDLLVQTVDVIAPIVDEPGLFGRIAAVNALSDVYAMGGTPLSALNIACFPSPALPLEVLKEIIAGALEALREAGALLLGGHTVNDPELKFGLSVCGLIQHGDPLSIDRAQVGDALFLTKPLGTGIVNQALRKGRLEGNAPAVQAAVASMVALNAAPARAARAAGAHAATDVTGFSLAGHCAQFARASGVTFEIDLARLPLLEGVEALVHEGVVPGRCRDNAEAYGAMVAGLGVGPASTWVHDPQTSGGLLVALPAASSQRFRDELRAWPLGVAEIGRVVPREGPAVRFR